MATLELRDLVRRYVGREAPAVGGLSLDVAAGELLAILGPSAAGKSTTLRLVAGYERPDAGRVVIDGRDVTALPPERRGVGMVFQHYALFPHLSVAANVAFGLAARGVPRGERRRRVDHALAAVGLDGPHDRAPQALSGGEQQRVALARALVIEPRVVLLDEPLSSLDPALRVATRDALRATLRGVTALLVTHDQDDAFAVADRVAILHGGRLLQVDTPEHLYDRPASRAVAAFVGRAALVPATRDGGDAVVTVGGIAQRAFATAPAAAVTRWLAVLRPESLALAPPDARGVWPGEVTARHFAGGVIACHIALDGPSVEVATTDRAVRVGDRVGVRLHASSVALVPDGTDPDGTDPDG